MTITVSKTRAPVRTIMTPDPVRVDGATSARELARILDENEVSGVPVVDPQDRVIGVVSRTDLVHQCVEGPLGSSGGSFLSSIAEGLGGELDPENLGVVSDFMNPEPITAGPEESIAAIGRRMFRERVHRVVIVDEERRVLGIVTSLGMLGVFDGD